MMAPLANLGRMVRGAPGSPGADGNDGQDGTDGSPGAPAAMQTIRVGSNVYTSDTLTEVVFPGASATLNGTILTIDSMKGEDGVEGLMERTGSTEVMPQ